MGEPKRAHPLAPGPARAPAATVDRAALTQHPLLALQRAVGNQAVQHLLREPGAVRYEVRPDHHRDGSAAAQDVAAVRVPTAVTVQRAEDGWTGEDVKPTSRNFEKKQVGKIWRIPIDGLDDVGNQNNDADTAYAWEKDPVTKKRDKAKPTRFVGERTRESAVGRAIVLIPDYLDLTQPVDVLLHLHGYGIGYREAKSGGLTRDEAIDLTESQLQNSGRNMIAVLPQGAYHSGFGRFAADPYLTAAFAKLTMLKDATRGRVVFTAHSGGGNTVAKILAEEVKEAERVRGGQEDKKGRSRLPSGMAELVLFDGLHGKAHETLSAWLKNQLDRDLAELTNAARKGKPDKQREYLKTSMRFRGYHTSGAGYRRRYEAVHRVLTDWFAAHEAALGAKGSVAYQGLRQNYQVIPTGLAPSEHETMIGKARGFEKSLQALDAVPPAAGAPNQPSPATRPTAPAVQRPPAASTGPAPAAAHPRPAPATVRPEGSRPFETQKFNLSGEKVTLVKANAKKKRATVEEAPADYAAAILKNAKIDAADWFSNFTTITFLGRRLNRPIHVALAEHLTGVQTKLADTYGGADKDAATAGDTLGLSKESIKGGREKPTSAAYSMHLFGLAVDLNYTANPFVSAKANPVFARAGLLVRGEAAQFESGMSFDALEKLDETLQTYFSYIDNAEELQDRLGAASVAPWKTKTPAEAARIIQQDLDRLASMWQRGKPTQKAILKAGGFLDLKEELVKGMDLDWGGRYGDMMHFDLRDKGVGTQVHKAIDRYKKKKAQESQEKYAEQEAAKQAAEAAKGQKSGVSKREDE